MSVGLVQEAEVAVVGRTPAREEVASPRPRRVQMGGARLRAAGPPRTGRPGGPERPQGRRQQLLGKQSASWPRPRRWVSAPAGPLVFCPVRAASGGAKEGTLPPARVPSCHPGRGQGAAAPGALGAFCGGGCCLGPRAHSSGAACEASFSLTLLLPDVGHVSPPCSPS